MCNCGGSSFRRPAILNRRQIRISRMVQQKRRQLIQKRKRQLIRRRKQLIRRRRLALGKMNNNN